MITRRTALIHGGLFAACCVTTTLVGGPVFGATLMTILLCHELGHYLVARRLGVDASLPYFIPLPPFLTLGTLGAVIRMKSTLDDRRALFDVGASGPIAGLVVAIPLLVIGLWTSDLGPLKAGDSLEGPSILYMLLKYAIFGRWLPGGGVDVQLNPMANAAWIGLLLTMVNLMPIGQLDGGHIARAVLGQRHEKLSAWLNVLLPVLGVSIGAIMLAIARHAGADWVDSLAYAGSGAAPWGVWAILLGAMRGVSGEYHAPVSDVPLDPMRRKLAIAMLVLFVLIATPVPFRPAL